jgi:hypothetical protein
LSVGWSFFTEKSHLLPQLKLEEMKFTKLYSKDLANLEETNPKAADRVRKTYKRELIRLTTDSTNYPTTGLDAEFFTPAGYKYNALGYDYDVE